MRINVYKLTYNNGHEIIHYDTNIFISQVNDYNEANKIKHIFNLSKIHRYAKSSLPSVYKNLTKTPLGDFINAGGRRLSLVNYRERFDTLVNPMSQSIASV